MSRFTMTLLAAAAAAVAAIAVVALPAIGDSGTTGTGNNPDLAACLATHGLPGAPTNDPELKRWLAGKENQNPGAVRAAIDACKPVDDGTSGSGPDAATVIACVRSHGLDAPTAPGDFKRWLAEQQQAGGSKSLDDALVACKIAPAPQDKTGNHGKFDCGAPTEKPPAAKPKTPSDTNAK
jgi:hypothetical protein